MLRAYTQNQFDANKNKYSLKNVKISLPHLKDFPETSPNDIRPPSFKELSLPYRDIFTLHQEINTFFQNLKNNICKYYTKKQIFYLCTWNCYIIFDIFKWKVYFKVKNINDTFLRNTVCFAEIHFLFNFTFPIATIGKVSH